ncbi:MAG: SET domain-containing protein-lysine N-methyltransferase [Verrucomicrobiota bacterium]
MSEESIEFKASAIHGMGGFALCKIKKGTPIIEYVGEKISKAESLVRCEANNPYIFNLDDEFDLDGDVSWNPAKFINHTCRPNAEAEFYGDQIWIMAIRDIEAGEEISFNYSYDLEDYKEHPCRCGKRNCVGYMVAEEFFPKFKLGDAGARREMEFSDSASSRLHG